MAENDVRSTANVEMPSTRSTLQACQRLRCLARDAGRFLDDRPRPRWPPGPAVAGRGRQRNPPRRNFAARFGLTDGRPRTLDEIGVVYGVTRERIRQIEATTMTKLRHPARSQVLRGYLE